MVQWINGNGWVILVALWVAVGSTARIIADRTTAYPRVHGVFVAIAGGMADMLQVLAGVRRAINGEPPPPPPPPASRRRAPSFDDDAPPTVRNAGRLLQVGLPLVVGGVILGCSSWLMPKRITVIVDTKAVDGGAADAASEGGGQ